MNLSCEAQTFHHDAQLCQYLLNSIASAHALAIRESNIPQAGSGLFAISDIPEGQEIFRSSPLVECVADGLTDSVCDLCYTNTLSRIHSSGWFRTKDDAVPSMIACPKCMKSCYCSEVSKYCYYLKNINY